MVRLLRHRQTKGAVTDKSGLQAEEPALYSTLLSLIVLLPASLPMRQFQTGISSYAAQFSNRRLVTRSNSRVLLVTNIASRLRA